MAHRSFWLLIALCAASAQPGFPQAADVREPGKVEGEELHHPAAKKTEDTDERPRLNPLINMQSRLRKLIDDRGGLCEDRTRSAQLIQDPASSVSEETSRLRLRLSELLTHMGTRRQTASVSEKPVPAPSPKTSPTFAPKQAPTILGAPLDRPHEPQTKNPTPVPAPTALDPAALAQALFRAGNHDGALQAYRLIPLDGLKADERAPVQYMMAVCLRRLDKIPEATSLFLEVANCKGDEQLAACAQWQLAAIRWHKELSEQLQDVRRRRQALEKQP